MSVENSCHFIGNLGKDPDMKYTPKGTPMTTFSIAVKGDNDSTMWVHVTTFGKTAEAADEILTSGALVAVEGRLRTFETGEGSQRRTGFGITANSWKVLSPKKGGGAAKKSTSAYKAPATPAADDYFEDDGEPLF